MSNRNTTKILNYFLEERLLDRKYKMLLKKPVKLSIHTLLKLSLFSTLFIKFKQKNRYL
jgi:hypothetical protein